eukprot:TRINITY_DN20102_c0_g1_i1.p1 TRINITY_DN20102_c0_g1~~TRINITY_DN20102_c0_g1_i1.p1  ORF type:complete len:639 (+),score=138.99 TRINITY_DN20102_c0_g1_i1:186-2102(+)
MDRSPRLEALQMRAERLSRPASAVESSDFRKNLSTSSGSPRAASGISSPSGLNFRLPVFNNSETYHKVTSPLSAPQPSRQPLMNSPLRQSDQYICWESPNRPKLGGASSHPSPTTINYYNAQPASTGVDDHPPASRPVQRLYSSRRDLYALNTTELARIQQLFQAIDVDGDEEIDQLELETAVTGCQELFDKIDTDADGGITCYEFEQFFGGLKNTWGEAALDVTLGYLMGNAAKKADGEFYQVFPMAEVFFKRHVGDVVPTKMVGPDVTMDELRPRVTALFYETAKVSGAVLGDADTLSATAVAAVFGPANDLFADLPATFTVTAWEGIFERLAASKGTRHADQALRSCEDHAYSILAIRGWLGPTLHKYRVVGAVHPTPSKAKPAGSSVVAPEEESNGLGNSMGLTNAELRAVQNLFAELDLDGSGALEADEIRTLHGQGRLFRTLDLNGDGQVTPTELELFMDNLKADSGSLVMKLVVEYLHKNAVNFNNGDPIAHLPIEAMFLEYGDLPPRVVSSDAEPTADDIRILGAVYADLLDTDDPVTLGSVKNVHGKHADSLLEFVGASGDKDQIGQDEWMSACEQLAKIGGSAHLAAAVDRLSRNIEVQELARSILGDEDAVSKHKSLEDKLGRIHGY